MRARKHASCTLSHYIAGLPDDRQGWLAGLRDPHIGRALTLLHATPAKAWSAEALAAEVGMSRSGFSERLTTLVHLPFNTSRAGACSSRGNGYVNRAKPSRRWDSAWATNPKPRSVARSSGSLVTQPPRGGAEPARASGG